MPRRDGLAVKGEGSCVVTPEFLAQVVGEQAGALKLGGEGRRRSSCGLEGDQLCVDVLGVGALGLAGGGFQQGRVCCSAEGERWGCIR